MSYNSQSSESPDADRLLGVGAAEHARARFQLPGASAKRHKRSSPVILRMCICLVFLWQAPRRFTAPPLESVSLFQGGEPLSVLVLEVLEAVGQGAYGVVCSARDSAATCSYFSC